MLSSSSKLVGSARVAMAEPTLYLFDGYNLVHAGAFKDRDVLVDTLASFVAGRGARGVVVFDGAGEERTIGPLQIRFTPHADDLLERLAAENRAPSSTSSLRCSTSSASSVERADAWATCSTPRRARSSSASGGASRRGAQALRNANTASTRR